MRLFRFDPEAGREIRAFDSRGVVMSRVVRSPGPVQIGCAHLSAGGVLGYHQATVDQLFVVLQGRGWVTGEDRVKRVVGEGQAAFWAAGEWHESGSESGMTAIIVEGEGLEPAAFMPELL